MAVTGHLSAHLAYGPIQFTVSAVEILDEESEATRATQTVRDAIRREGLEKANKKLPFG